METERPWYRLHLLTWLVLLITSAGLIYLNATPRSIDSSPRVRFSQNGNEGETSYSISKYGFPCHAVTIGALSSSFIPTVPPSQQEVELEPSTTKYRTRIEYEYLLLDIALFFLSIFCAVRATECYRRRSERWYQFTIETIVMLGVFVALLAAFIRFDGPQHYRFEWHLLPMAGLVLFLIWCMFWNAWTFLRYAARSLTADAP